MNEKEEAAYALGRRAGWVALLHQALRELGYEDIEAKKAAWVTEREAAIAQLRMACDEFGDNDWPDDLHIADIIEKHLVAYIETDEEED